MKYIFIALIYIYQYTLGYFLGGRCRFYPSCSHYALECFKTHNTFKALYLTIKRLFRCHPFCKGGIDLVPENTKKK